MTRSLPPVNWFRVFDSAARHLKFTAAAEELGITQSAVSQQIRLLELRLGTQLFVRQPRRLSLTDAGRKLFPQVSKSIQHLTQATEMFDLGAGQQVLTVATSVSVAQWIIAPHLTDFQAQHPDLKIRLLSTIWADDFKSSVSDVEIRFGSQAQVGQGAQRLSPDALCVVAHPSCDPLAPPQKLIEAVGTTQGWRHWVAENPQIDVQPSPDVFVDSYGMAITLALQNAGVALVSSVLVRPMVQSGELIELGKPVSHPSEGYFLAVNDTSPAAQAFQTWFLGLPHFTT